MSGGVMSLSVSALAIVAGVVVLAAVVGLVLSLQGGRRKE
jgi:hypothetical protein